MQQHSRFKTARNFLLFWCLFIGLGAVAGSIGMLSKPDGSALGMQTMLPYFQVLPLADILFQDYVFSGIALLCVNGLSNLTAAVLLLRHRKLGIILGGIFGVTLMLWICIQFVIFPLNFMSTIYFIFGAAQAATGYAAWVFYQQEQLTFDPQDYPLVGSNPRELVVYFSRMGYTRQAAYEIAEQSGAEIYEIRATEPVDGTKGFWWCGRFGMHRWPMPIEKITVDLTAYDKVTICSPIWVFALAGPVRSFCQAAAGQIKKADYVFLHHMKTDFKNAAVEMDSLLQLQHHSVRNICCRLGKQS